MGRLAVVHCLDTELLADLGRRKFFACVRCRRAADVHRSVERQFPAAFRAECRRHTPRCGVVSRCRMEIGAGEASGRGN